MVLYTDGITEAFDIARQQYGIERLCKVVSQNCKSTALEIKQAVIEHVRLGVAELDYESSQQSNCPTVEIM